MEMWRWLRGGGGKHGESWLLCVHGIMVYLKDDGLFLSHFFRFELFFFVGLLCFVLFE
jgi:hypothetical protein